MNDDILIVFFNGFYTSSLNLDKYSMPGIRFSDNPDLATVADVVVVHTPDAANCGLNLPDKVYGQIWVSWSMESAANYPTINSQKFDLKMTYHSNSDIPVPYYAQYDAKFIDALKAPVTLKEDGCTIAAFVSSKVNQSNRLDYLEKLGQYIDIHHYGTFKKNRILNPDQGGETKLEVFSRYKFCIAFENSISEDYVTEKFYDPLLVGSTPVYLGAPNIQQFAPHPDSFVDVQKFESPRTLASYLISIDNDGALYSQHMSWKSEPLDRQFVERLSNLGDIPHAFYRLATIAKKLIRPRSQVFVERNEHWELIDLASGCLLVNELENRRMKANETLTLILKLCDGEKSIQKIITSIVNQYSSNTLQIESEVLQAITSILKLGIIKKV